MPATWRLLYGPVSGPHLLNQSDDQREGCQAHGSHSQAKELLHEAVRAVRQLLCEHDLQNLQGRPVCRSDSCKPCMLLSSDAVVLAADRAARGHEGAAQILC